MISKTRSVFDPSVSSESDNIGAYLRSSDGTLLTHTVVGADNALDVNIVAAVGSYLEDSAHVSGDAGQFILAVRNDAESVLVSADGDYSPLQTDATGRLKVQASVTSNFEYDEDSAHVSGDKGAFILAVRNDVEGSLVSADGDYSPLQVDSLGRLRVYADLDVINGFEKAEDAAHVSGDIGGYMLSVREDTLASSTSASGDYQSFKTDAIGRLYTNNSGQTAAYGAVSVTTTATDIVATDLVNRRSIIIQNLSNNRSVYIGSNASVTTGSGFLLSPHASVELDIAAGVNVHGIANAGTADIRYFEIGS